jgi:predicted MFS family arabinose efflux permease
VLGETVRHATGPDVVWLMSAGWCLVAALLAIGVPAHLGQAASPATRPAGSWMRRYLHPAALGPGVVLALATTGFAGFAAFVPLYVDEIGLRTSGTVFAIYSGLVLAVRIFGAQLPDRLGPIRASSIALTLQAIGFIVLTVWASVAGLYTGAVIYALGVALHFPALMRLVVDAAPATERSHAVATFSLFFDVSQGLGAAVLGGLVALAGERAAFAASAALAAVGVVILRRWVAPRAAAALAAPEVVIDAGLS